MKLYFYRIAWGSGEGTAPRLEMGEREVVAVTESPGRTEYRLGRLSPFPGYEAGVGISEIGLVSRQGVLVLKEKDPGKAAAIFGRCYKDKVEDLKTKLREAELKAALIAKMTKKQEVAR